MLVHVALILFQTGTLTEEGLDMWGVVPVDDTAFQPAVHNPSELPLTGKMATAMATCHSLTIIDGELTGDPLDVKMFNSVNWVSKHLFTYNAANRKEIKFIYVTTMNLCV